MFFLHQHNQESEFNREKKKINKRRNFIIALYESLVLDLQHFSGNFQ